MNYLSVCSGIEAATCAWHPLGWNPIGFSEIEPFPCKVLAHHYPNVPNLGDMTKFKEWPDATINVLVGGTPCQSFSVAGLRKGLDDPRGNLMLTYLAIADRYKPKWIVWENVPGVLSSNGGRDFGTFLGGLGQLGYGFAYRVLDAQFSRTHEHPRAVPQRRRRVFVIGCLGDWRSAAAVLFDSESLRGNPPPSRSKGQEIAGTIGARTGVSIGAQDAACGHILPVTCMSHGQANAEILDNLAPTLNCNHEQPIAYIGGIDNENNGHGMDVTGPLLKGSPTGVGRPLPAIVYALAGNTIGRAPENGGNGTGFDDTGPSYTLTKTDVHAVAFAQNTRDEVRLINGDGQIAGALAAQPGMKQTSYIAYGIDGASHYLRSGASKADKPCSTTYIEQQMKVRRLTPLECERLQGFPEIKKSVIIAVCLDHQKTNALAETQCPKLPNVAGNAVVSESQKIASFAEVNSQQSNHKTSELAEVSALLNLEARTLEIHNQGKLLLSVNLAEMKNKYPPLIEIENIARLLVQQLNELDQKAKTGKAELHQNIKPFLCRESGNLFVDLSGREIGALANAAELFTKKLSEHTKSTMSEAGQNSLNSELNLKTLCCFAMVAINLYIPEQTHNGNSYVVNLSVSHGYTNIPGASNSARYKALGNSMAVNCMRILGERIAMMETIDVISDLL